MSGRDTGKPFFPKRGGCGGDPGVCVPMRARRWLLRYLMMQYKHQWIYGCNLNSPSSVLKIKIFSEKNSGRFLCLGSPMLNGSYIELYYGRPRGGLGEAGVGSRVRRVRGDWPRPPMVPTLSCITIGPGESPEKLRGDWLSPPIVPILNYTTIDPREGPRVRQTVREDKLGPLIVPILNCTTIGPGEGPKSLE